MSASAGSPPAGLAGGWPWLRGRRGVALAERNIFNVKIYLVLKIFSKFGILFQIIFSFFQP